MFEEFRKITIQGGYYEEYTDLELFRGNKTPLSIVYGRNGSGKTTIAKAIRQLIGKDTEQQTEEGYVSYAVNLNVSHFEDKKDSIFVFDEDFVKENIKTKGKGLETIVMIGEQVDLDKQISAQKEKRSIIEKKIEQLSILKEKYENEKDTSSPKYFHSEIRDALRVEGGWADIDREVKGNSVKSKVTEDLLNKLLDMEEPTDTEETLREKLNADLNLYKQTSDAQIIEWQPETLILPNNLHGVKNLLERKIEKPQLTEREQQLLTFLQNHAEFHTQKITQQLATEKWTFCPLCLRENSEEVYESINKFLNRLMNRESEMYSKALDEIMVTLDDVELSLSVLPEQAFDKEKTAATIALNQLNKDLANIRAKIEHRKRDLYGVMEVAFTEAGMNKYAVHLENVKNAIRALAVSVDKFNQSVNERKALKNKVLKENEMLARKRLSALLKTYQHANKTYSERQTDLLNLIKAKEQVDIEIKGLIAKIERTDIALEYINKELQYVFFSDKKVKLIADEGCYKLMINGRKVPPKKISIGERNVLGLCYFFAKLFAKKKEDDLYKEEMLIVIDDPVSSFDQGNRLGVMSLLRYQFSNIKKGNNNSRMLVLTHDLRTAFDLVKIRSELNKGKSGDNIFWELTNKKMEERKISNEYKKLLKCVYSYAKNADIDSEQNEDDGIGNVMRRVVEAYASFCYNMSFEEMMCREGVLKNIPDEKRSFYENFMCRLALNSESHMKEYVYDINTVIPYFTKQEKIQTAKSLLLFLCYINEEHLSCYLNDKCDNNEDIIKEIRSWET